MREIPAAWCEHSPHPVRGFGYFFGPSAFQAPEPKKFDIKMRMEYIEAYEPKHTERYAMSNEYLWAALAGSLMTNVVLICLIRLVKLEASRSNRELGAALTAETELFLQKHGFKKG